MYSCVLHADSFLKKINKVMDIIKMCFGLLLIRGFPDDSSWATESNRIGYEGRGDRGSGWREDLTEAGGGSTRP